LKERKQDGGLEGHGLMTCCNGRRKTSIMK